MGTPGDSTAVWWRGSRFDPRTLAMLQEAERISGIRVEPTQGSYSSGVGASAGSHDGGGAADLSVRTLSRSQRAQLVAALRRVGFAAWLRTHNQGFTMDHIHAVAVACPDLAPLAARQVKDYHAGRNGLKNGAPDDGPRDHVGQTWETYQASIQPPAIRRPSMITIKASDSDAVYLLGGNLWAGITVQADLVEIQKALKDPGYTATVSRGTFDNLKRAAGR